MPGTRSSSVLPKTLGWFEPIFIHLLSYNPVPYTFLFAHPPTPLAFILHRSCLCDSPHPVSTLFQISPGRQLRHVTGALVITEVGSRAHLWGRKPKILWKPHYVKKHQCGQCGAQRGMTTCSRQPRLTMTPKFSPPLNLFTCLSVRTGLRGWRPTFGSLLFSPLSAHSAHIPVFSSSSFFFLIFFSWLASGPLELYLISFCWVN